MEKGIPYQGMPGVASSLFHPPYSILRRTRGIFHPPKEGMYDSFDSQDAYIVIQGYGRAQFITYNS